MPFLEWFKELRRSLRSADNGFINEHEEKHEEKQSDWSSPPNADPQKDQLHFQWNFEEDDVADPMLQQMNEMLKDMEGILKGFPMESESFPGIGSFGSFPGIGSFESFPDIGSFPQFSIEQRSADTPGTEDNPRDQMLKRNGDRFSQQHSLESSPLEIPEFRLLPKGSMRRDEDLDAAVVEHGADAGLDDQRGSPGIIPPHTQAPQSWFSHRVSTSRQTRHLGDGRVEERVVESSGDGSVTERITRSVGDATCHTTVQRRADGSETRHDDVQGTQSNDRREFDQLWTSVENTEFGTGPKSLFDKLFPFRP